MAVCTTARRPGALCLTALLASSPVAEAAEGTRITITGEIIDTWCYYSGVMGGPDAIQGTAHHTCALWCSAGGTPVGLMAPDGAVYMVLKIEGAATSAGGDTALRLASHEVAADGILYERDGINYIVVENVISDAGIVNPTHEDFGPVPPFAIPEPQ